MPARLSQKLARGWTILARTLLATLLLAQLTALWVVAHTSPTRLPVGVIDAFAELTSDRIDFECREVTVDSRGRIRLAGVRLSEADHPGDALTGDVDILPDWRGLLMGRPGLIGLQVRARGTIGGDEGGSDVDDVVVRLAHDNGDIRIQAAARAGTMVVRADMLGAITPDAASSGEPADGGAVAWDRELALGCLRGLRSVDGGIGITVRRELATLSGGFVDNAAALSPLPVQAARGTLRARWGSQLQAEMTLAGVRIGNATAAWSRLAVDDARRVRFAAEGLRFDGIVDASASGSGRWQTDGRLALRVTADTAESHVSTEVEVAKSSIRIHDATARLCAADLTRLSVVAQAARGAGVDLGGHIDILGGAAVWTDGALASIRAAFALGQSGWGELRPGLVRPEKAFPSFCGELELDLRSNRLALTRLDLAGIQGEITGGLRAGDAFAIHLHSTTGSPVNPSCLNALLGGWWADLWSRFDLSTRETRPHADVRVIGKWGVPESIHTTVRAKLENFGFMGARFRGTDVWVFAHPGETLVRIDSLRGELEGKDAGSAHGTVRWDWRRPEWQGQPQIDAEGDLLPACALRLHDPAAAARIRAWEFPKPRLRLALGPGRPLRVDLESTGTSTIEGVRVDDLRLTVTQPAGAKGDLAIEGTGNLSGGKASLSLSGDLATRNHLQVSVREWSRTGAANLIEQLGGPRADKASPDNSILTVVYEGDWDFTQPRNPVGKGQVSLVDPNLKTIHLFGLLSSGLDTLGIGISSYRLDRAEVTFTCANGKAELTPLRFIGDDASLNLKGTISFQDGGLDLSGRFELEESPWGPLKYINPNRLITKMISVDVGGTLTDPKVRTKILDLGKVK